MSFTVEPGCDVRHVYITCVELVDLMSGLDSSETNNVVHASHNNNDLTQLFTSSVAVTTASVCHRHTVYSDSLSVVII